MFGMNMGRMGGTGRVGGAPIWTPAANFASGELGLWYDPSTFAGLYQDSAGTSPTTAVGQPAGLMLDKRLGLVLGPELVVNGGFDNGVTGWASADANGDIAIVGGCLELTAKGAGYPRAAQAISTSAGKTYKISGDMYCGSSSQAEFLVGTSAGSANLGRSGLSFTSTTPANRGLIFTAAGATTYVSAYIDRPTVGLKSYFDNISIKELPGNHSSQATASARPLISATGAIQYTTFDGLDDGMSTGAITLGSDMDCFIAVKRTSATGILLYTTAGSGVYLGALDATAGAASAGAGTPTYAVNGVDVAGGTGTTRTQLAAAIPIGSWVVLEIRNANLSAWATLAMGAYTGFPMGMDFAQGIVCPAGDAATRTKNRQFAGAKAGLSL